MRDITIVFTVHREKGRCNEQELLAILEAINPEVVFEELRASDHESIYKEQSTHSLEIRTLCNYRADKPIRQVPVDNFVIPEGFKSGVDELFDYVESNSKEYREAFENIDRMSALHGFPYLNSLKHLEMKNEADELFEHAISISESDRLKSLLSAWYRQLRGRERAILDGIYDFSRNNHFSRGVFLVGSAHMSYFMKLIEVMAKAEPELINWRIFGAR